MNSNRSRRVTFAVSYARGVSASSEPETRCHVQFPVASEEGALRRAKAEVVKPSTQENKSLCSPAPQEAALTLPPNQVS